MALALALALTAAGCVAPEPVLRMTPLSENVLWLRGTAAFLKENSVGRVAMAFDRQEGQMVAFHVEIENAGTEPLLIDPAAIYYAACNRSQDGQIRRCAPAHWATDPEKVLLALDVAHSRQVAGEVNEAALLGSLAVLDMAAAVAGGARHGSGALAAASGGHALATAAAIESQQRRHGVMFEAERLRWSSAALRKTTLVPGGRVAGLIYLPRETGANEIAVQVRMGKDTLEFPFKQTFIDVRPVRTANGRFPGDTWHAP
jgi:hypothetical protein